MSSREAIMAAPRAVHRGANLEAVRVAAWAAVHLSLGKRRAQATAPAVALVAAPGAARAAVHLLARTYKAAAEQEARAL